MHHGVENLMRLAGLSLAEAVRVATINPAYAGNVPARSHGLVPGDRADIVQFRLTASHRIEIVRTWIDGVRVFPS
jgi:N-acetylglucosamine-6-phosphate deacetylase